VRVSSALEHLEREGADDADDAREHRGDGVVLEEDVAREELGDDGAERPQVDLLVVRQPEDHLRSTVSSTKRVGFFKNFLERFVKAL